MIRPVACLLFLAACSSAPGPAGPAGERGPAGESADSAMLVALAQRVAELEARKAPHLVHAETGEDLGRMLDWQTAWSEELGAPVRVVSTGVRYASDDCKGEARIWDSGPYHVTLPDGAVVMPMPVPGEWAARSRLDMGAGCRAEIVAYGPGNKFVDSGIRMPPARASLIKVEMR